MELEEAISKLEYELDKSKIVKKYQGKPKELFDDLDEYIKSIETVLNHLTKQEKMIMIYQNTGKLVKNKIDGTIGVVLREWETGQIQVLEKIQPKVINTHDSWKTLELIEESE